MCISHDRPFSANRGLDTCTLLAVKLELLVVTLARLSMSSDKSPLVPTMNPPPPSYDEASKGVAGELAAVVWVGHLLPSV